MVGCCRKEEDDNEAGLGELYVGSVDLETSASGSSRDGHRSLEATNQKVV